MTTLLFRSSPPPAPAIPTTVAAFSSAAPQRHGGGVVVDASAHAVAALGALRHRPSIYDLDAAALNALRDAFRKMYAIGDERGYQYWAGLHGLPPPVYCQHGTPLFAVWHRPYLYLFEKALQDQVAGVMLPYWDWTSARAQAEGMPKAFTDETYKDAAGVDQPNPLFQADIKFSRSMFPSTFRDPSAPRDLKALANLVTKAQSKTSKTYEIYTGRLENPHNGLHGWVGGTMGQVAYAAYDPIFWAHHANVDRLFAAWQALHPKVVPGDDIYNAVLAPFAMTTKDIWSTRRLGYDYAPDHATQKLLSPELTERVSVSGFIDAARTSKFNDALLKFSPAALTAEPRPIELELREVKPPKSSFEIRVFLNQTDATAATPTEGNPHFAGSLHLFGHGECGGDAGHCDVPTGPRDPFDFRLPHHLTPMTLRLDVGAALAALAASASEVAVTLIAVDPKGKQIPNPGTDFDSVAIIG